jgi:isoleucyl-tRNA synthetase
LAWLQEHAALIAEELNVKAVEYTEKADQYITYTVQPDLKRLGPRLGKQLPDLKKALATADAADLLARLEKDGSVTLDLPGGPVVLDGQDLQVRLQAKEGWAAAQGALCVVVLATEVDEGLLAEGLARELVHAIQNVRKDQNLEYTARIETGLVTPDAALSDAANRFRDYIQGETLTVRLVFEPLPGVEPIELNLGGVKAQLYVRVAK